MKLKNVVFLLTAFFLNQNAGAGAWDIGPFDNDDALDWVYELESSSNLSAVQAALAAVANEDSYIQAPTGSNAIAAAEVVAALLGKPHPRLPPEVASWVDGRNLSDSSELVALAKQVIARVQHPTKSELAQLYSESEEFFEAWKSTLSDLEQRLK